MSCPFCTLVGIYLSGTKLGPLICVNCPPSTHRESKERSSLQCNLEVNTGKFMGACPSSASTACSNALIASKSYSSPPEVHHRHRRPDSTASITMAPPKYWAVREGHNPGVYSDWDSAKAQVVSRYPTGQRSVYYDIWKGASGLYTVT